MQDLSVEYVFLGNLLTDHLQIGVLNRYSLLYHPGQRNP